MLPDEVAHLAVTTQLPDGAVLSLRPIRPDDGPMLAEGFRRLSPESLLRKAPGCRLRAV